MKTGNDGKIRIIFIGLLIDILAFTIILPLLPRLLEHYDKSHVKSHIYSSIASFITTFRQSIGVKVRPKMDILLFGGLVGSLFSFLQFISSPIIGKLSDTYGRRNVLLISMIGNALSMILWIFANSFEVFLLSRIVGGLTEGNVQMAIAMISDLTTPETRSKSLALVGMSFAFGFTFGPPIGAYLTRFNIADFFPGLYYLQLNNYSTPALFALVLIIIETVFLALYLPETRNYKKNINEIPEKEYAKSESVSSSIEQKKIQTRSRTKTIAESPQAKVTVVSKDPLNPIKIRYLSFINFIFVFVFSGMEFTLTFLTFDRFEFSHSSQGRLLGFIGLISALFQGFYVRKYSKKVYSEKTIAIQGIISCAIGLFINGVLAYKTEVLYFGCIFLAFTSGTVVNSLTAIASLGNKKNIGYSLGVFRSYGQLGRSLGPIVFCSLYWLIGSNWVYFISSVMMIVVSGLLLYIC